ncbi:DUF3322 domain-containing protein [Uliginosibacterium sediminicola]|uniref:DUF3322 domain-containing protein n=1 Tax=Uliginosibacterium sediminicola TaxID=2024550 RepID=A0ABU9YZ82_9RHOO
MNWTTQADVRAQVQRLWDRGELLRACVSDEFVWPLRLSFRGPASGDLSDRFEAVRDWAKRIVEIAHVRLEWREWSHRVQGCQRLPSAIFVDSLADALAMIGKASATERFRALWQMTEGAQPVLLAWLQKRPMQALELSDCWPRLLAVVAWMKAHPRPGIYMRQVDVSGVDTKFIESHRGVLAELFDLALPVEAIDDDVSGVFQFVRRYGFQEKPVRIRFRMLDPEMVCVPGCKGLVDVTLDAESFAALSLPLERVFITENETNFLAFPSVPRSIVLFGAGYGWDALSRADWLRQCRVHYWGDLDTHGFAILDQFRCYFPHAESFLMNREVLLAHRVCWVKEPEPSHNVLSRLTESEAELYDDLRFDRIEPKVRLEQERIGFGFIVDGLCRLET